MLFNGRWGTVCDDNFDKLDGQVVCSQLNQGAISRIANPMEFPVGTNDQPIWLDEVQCTGDERWLSACPHPGYGDNDCFHSEDVAIVCTGELFTTTLIVYNDVSCFHRRANRSANTRNKIAWRKQCWIRKS